MDWTLDKWHFAKLCAAFAAFFGVLRVERGELAEKILKGSKNFGLFKLWAINWKQELHEECVDAMAYTSGRLFTRYLRKYGED